jgi:hypothetical protein
VILVVHCRRSHYDVLIDRTTKWGNPFTHVRDRLTRASFLVPTREEAIAAYERWVLAQPDLVAALSELRDKILGCWCRPLACHGDVLIRLANQ